MLATGCTKPVPVSSAGPRLDLMGPTPDFAQALANEDAPAGWMLIGDTSEETVQVVTRAGVPGLRVSGTSGALAVARPLDVPLQIMPFLSWSWYLESGDRRRHSVRLVVGFGGGAQEPRTRRALFAGVMRSLPPHDRTLVLTWEGSALARGSLTTVSPPGAGATARYAVRGGAENAGSWWVETVDLSELYRRAWPNDALGNTRVAFVGVVGTGTNGTYPDAPGGMLIAGVRLSR